VSALSFQFSSEDFQPAIGQASSTVKKPHEIVKALGIATNRALKAKSEGLGIFYPMPKVICFSIFVSKNGNHLLGEISPHAIAMETFLENYEAEFNIGHFPLVLASRHFHLLRKYEELEDGLPPD
jgi:hypothetical protein